LAEALLIFAIAFTPLVSGVPLLVAWDLRRRSARTPGTLAASIRGIALAQAWAPAAVLAGFLLLVATAWISVGAKPTLPSYDFSREPWGSHFVGGPHPGAYDPWRGMLGLVGIMSLLGIVVAPAWFALSRAAGHRIGSRTKLAYYAGWTAVAGLLAFDPFGLVMWAFGD
jgi:hypothetical protein